MYSMNILQFFRYKLFGHYTISEYIESCACLRKRNVIALGCMKYISQILICCHDNIVKETHVFRRFCKFCEFAVARSLKLFEIPCTLYIFKFGI